MRDNTQEAFFALVRGGLWEEEVRLSLFGKVNYDEVMRLAEEQSVVGLVTAGLEHVQDVKIPQETLLQFIGQTMQIEQQNKAMNNFIVGIVVKMRDAGIYALLAKGQGVAQCYDKPLWRSCGDVDFFLSEENFREAKAFLTPMASTVDQERGAHLGMTIGEWVVELHGNLHCGLSSRIDKVMDDVFRDSFYNGNIRSWINGNTQVFMLAVEYDVLFVFTHFLKHFYKGGLGLRQICDWSRLLFFYSEKLNQQALESRIRKAGLMSEWKAFGAFAVEYLGMPVYALPLYNESDKQNANLKKKAERIKDFILMSGNFGHNRDMSYYSKYPFVIRKCCSMWMRVSDLYHHARIFPMDSLRFFPRIMWNGMMSAVRGEG